MATKKKSVSKEKPATLHKGKKIDEGKPLAEGKTPKADAVTTTDSWKGGSKASDCKRSDCRHPSGMHYGNKDRWCNTAGCTCQAYLE